MGGKFAFVVTSGSYSEYGINAVFDDEEKALTFCARENKGVLQDSLWYTRVEVYPLNDGDYDKSIHSIFVNYEGEIIEEESDSHIFRSGHDYYKNGGVWGSSVRGRDVALKAARDNLARWKAEQAGIS